MKVQLKSNGTQHEIPSETWKKMSRDQRSAYAVISSADTVEKPQTVKNEAAKEKTDEVKKIEKSENGDKK